MSKWKKIDDTVVDRHVLIWNGDDIFYAHRTDKDSPWTAPDPAGGGYYYLNPEPFLYQEVELPSMEEEFEANDI